ncbi:phosphotransferase family protein [Natrinema amylolyticum]|uniref:phosphotransferase family protein n=1 Tax=Natrinema amylolyticum TaxID=2878679 RepID=UPI001CFBB21B|nr:phosphotransferase family protein [Natrinema amylolyticum]
MTLEVDDITGELEPYLSGRLADSDVTVTDLERHTEGWSRQTMSFTTTWTDGGTERSERLVARVDPGHGEERQFDYRNEIQTEFETMRSVYEADVDVPVPEPYWFEADQSVLGGPFFLVSHRPGTAPVTWDPRDRNSLYDSWDRDGKPLPNQLVDVIANIHELDGDDVPCLETKDPQAFVDDTLELQRRSYEATKLVDEPAVNEIIDWLEANKPEVPETTLVHGDLRIGNMLLHDESVSAVLDWEMSAIGDPMFDVAYSSLRYFAGKLVEPTERPNLAGAVVDREWFYDEYEKRTGRTIDPDRLRYWRVFGAFRMMNSGIGGAYRFHTGESDDVRSAWFQYIVPGLIEDMLDLIEADRT